MLDAFLKILNGERANQIVWTADITYWMAGQRQAGTAKPEWDTEKGCLELHNELGILPYYYYEKLWAAEARYDDSVKVIDAKEGDKSIRQFRTPVGDLKEETVYSPLSCSLGITKHFVESERDLDVLLYILQHRRLEPANLADWPKAPSDVGGVRRPTAHRAAAVSAGLAVGGVGRRAERRLFAGGLPPQSRRARCN